MEVKKHLKDWEWVNFLSFIAEAPQFAVANGRNGIENARASKLFDVLIFASEKKGYEAAQNAYQKRMYKL